MDKIEVTQNARQAAFDAYLTYYEIVPNDLWLQALLDGKHDGDEMAQAFARFERDILATRTDATPVAFISAERLNRKREFEANGAVVYDRPLGTSTMPLYTHPPAMPVARKQFPILGSRGAKIDLQLVEDHGKQAYSNHYQTVERLAERGGLSWCELHAVLNNRAWQKVDENTAITECRAIEARYLGAFDPPATDVAALVEAAKWAMRELRGKNHYTHSQQALDCFDQADAALAPFTKG